MKQKGKIAKVAVARPALACKGVLDGPNKTFYDEYFAVLDLHARLLALLELGGELGNQFFGNHVLPVIPDLIRDPCWNEEAFPHAAVDCGSSPQ